VRVDISRTGAAGASDSAALFAQRGWLLEDRGLPATTLAYKLGTKANPSMTWQPLRASLTCHSGDCLSGAAMPMPTPDGSALGPLAGRHVAECVAGQLGRPRSFIRPASAVPRPDIGVSQPRAISMSSNR
jgi:hypothetical protein